MTEKPPHFDDLCRQLGVVVLQAQIVEHNLALFLATSRKLELDKVIDEVYAALESDNRKAIERLLNQVRQQFPLNSDLDERIWKVKEERNWLVHRLQRESPRATFSEDEAAPVFARIERLTMEITAVLTEMDKIGDQLMLKHGFDPSNIRQRAAEIRKRSGSQPDN
jgi:hypothetical protein